MTRLTAYTNGKLQDKQSCRMNLTVLSECSGATNEEFVKLGNVEEMDREEVSVERRTED